MEQDRLRQRAATEWEWYDRQPRLRIEQQLRRLQNPYTETVSGTWSVPVEGSESTSRRRPLRPSNGILVNGRDLRC